MDGFNDSLPIRNNSFQKASLFDLVDQAIQSHGSATLSGEGGTGKSQIALEYCHRYKNKHPRTLILWIPSGSKERFEQSLREVARDLSLLDQTDLSANIVAHFRANDSRDFLFVFDDIGQDVFLESCKQEFGKRMRSLESSTIIVQRLGEETLEAVIDHSVNSENASVKVKALQPVEAKALLRAQCGNRWDEKAAENVVQKLDMSVLALILATSYIGENNLTVAGYMQQLEAIIKYVPASSAIPRSIWLALRLSITQIKREKPRAFKMLSLVSVIDRQSVNEGFLVSEHEKARSFYGAIRLLKALSLLQPGRHRESYFIHRYTQLFMLEELEEDGLLQVERQQSVKWTSRRYPQGDQSNWSDCQMLLPHAYKILEYSVKDQNEALLLKKVAEYYRYQGQYDVSFKLYNRARAIYSSSEPQGSTKWQEERLDLDIKAAQALCGSSQYAKAEAILKQTLENTKSLLRVNHPSLITVNSTLALIYESQGHYQLAADMYRTALEANTKLHYENHIGSLTFKSNLSVALTRLGQYAEAEKLQIEAIEGRIWLRGAEHPDTIQSIANLAVLLQHQNRHAEAAEMNQEILVVGDRVQGPEHPDTLNIVNNLSINLRSLGRFFEAESMQRRLLDARVRQLGAEHEGAINARLNLATTLEKLGKYSEAEKEVRAGLESNKKIFPDPTHPTTLRILNTLGLLLLRQGSFAEAEPILRDGLEATKANFKTGENYRPVLISKNNYAGTMLRLQRYEASKKLFVETLDEAREYLGEEDPFTLRVTNSLSQVWREGVTVLGTEEQKLDVLHEAEKLQRTALAGRMKVCGLEHPDTLTSIYQLGRVLQDLERYGEARELYEKALAGFEVKLGSEHETTIECRKHLAFCLNQI